MIINHTADESSDVGGCIFRKQHLTIWQVFCVLNKEYFMLSVGWPGMRLATSFSFGFGVNDAFIYVRLSVMSQPLSMNTYRMIYPVFFVVAENQINITQYG